MKTLEDEAQEYAVLSGALNAGYSTEIKEAYKEGAKETQRWFPVGKEMPDTSDFGISENVILKLSVYNKGHKTAYTCCVEAYYDGDIDTWHFMLPISSKGIKLTPVSWRPIDRR